MSSVGAGGLGVGNMENPDDVQKKVFLSKDDPVAALADLLSLVSQAEEGQPDPPRGGVA